MKACVIVDSVIGLLTDKDRQELAHRAKYLQVCQTRECPPACLWGSGDEIWLKHKTKEGDFQVRSPVLWERADSAPKLESKRGLAVLGRRGVVVI